jgi:hypothetical protein
MQGVARSLKGVEGMSYNRYIAEQQPKRWLAEGQRVAPDDKRKEKAESKGFSKKDLSDLVAQIATLLN